MKSNSINLQDYFLNQARKEKIAITIFLMNGVQLKGLVRGFDSYIVVLDTDGKQQMIYKHAISTIIPSQNINLTSNVNPSTPE
ncbi:RNA-binding protein Hfq [Peptoclostridium litorale DSM 5388]|uniref:RNA-binding protein Hfq n=1 Tax=Peptoclostridium litorale DSM 5388 TaxID=1121324 RepID=A0A069RDZ7_PEPLI|nr:RNA chaperone Hfq [Peptoclostridium litorale]KDR95251.1 RNA-binding protein Hfq [Peptoclostridium litorale DSM 5388]SIN72720.1 RNA-binding protein Hfq [Peptoclostridium litorale DSM 5388]